MLLRKEVLLPKQLIMNRNLVSLLLIPFVLLTQSVTCGHSHAVNQPVEHDLRAQAHLDLSADDEQHGHSHGNHSHTHAGTDHDHDQPVTPGVETPFDHDSSAVYLNSIDLIVGTRSSISLNLNDLLQWSLPVTDLSIDAAVSYGPERSVHDCALSDPDTPLFIRHHAFLI